MKLSIIIPVYGVESYIGDCLQSCIDNIGDDSSDVEVVIVDDGSKDRSIDIAQKLISGFSYFHIIHQENQGLSMARNNGMLNATGDYIWFIDSDDIIAKGVVIGILKTIEQFESLDMIELGYQYVPENVDRTTLPVFNSEFQIKTLKGKEHFVEGFLTPVPFHVFKREFLNSNKLRLYPGIYHEDSEFTPRAIWLSNNVAIILGVAYYYRRRENSIMTTRNPQKGENYIFVSHRLQDFFEGQDINARTRKVINDYVAMTYCNGLNNVIGANFGDRKRVAVAAYEHRAVLRSLKDAIQIKYRILGFLGSLCPKWIAVIYSIMMKFNKKK